MRFTKIVVVVGYPCVGNNGKLAYVLYGCRCDSHMR